MSRPDEEPDPRQTTRRRPSHFRKKTRQDATKTIARVSSQPQGARRDAGRVVQRHRARHEDYSEVINQAPALPDPLLQRPIPPPAPLPSESAVHDPWAPGWLEDRHRRRRVEDALGTIGLAVLVAAMLVAMWLQMQAP